MKKELLYEGKAKKVYATEKPEVLLLEFKDSLTAFNAQKKGSFDGKGVLNKEIASLIFGRLKKAGIDSHFISNPSPTEMEVVKVNIIPLEVVVRNILAGSTAKKMGIEEGKVLPRPLVEFYFKDDNLADPFVSDDQAILFEIATEAELAALKHKALKVNEVLADTFKKIGIKLVDFKIEFGKNAKGDILLADEITPDCCRLWDEKTGEKLDKDRFRRDLGNVEESYRQVLSRLKETL
jgi:phosphoribosylaminoimidazole-succinocarboxamide synthase